MGGAGDEASGEAGEEGNVGRGGGAQAVVTAIEDAVVEMFQGCNAGRRDKMLQVACGAAVVLQGLVRAGGTCGQETLTQGGGEMDVAGVDAWPGVRGVEQLVLLAPLLCSREAAGEIAAHWMGAGWVEWGDRGDGGGERVNAGGASDRPWVCQVLAPVRHLCVTHPFAVYELSRRWGGWGPWRKLLAGLFMLPVLQNGDAGEGGLGIDTGTGAGREEVMRIVLDLASVMPPCAQESGGSEVAGAGASAGMLQSWAAARVCQRLEFHVLSSERGEAEDCGGRSGSQRWCDVERRWSAEPPAEDWDGQVWFHLAMCSGGACDAAVEDADRQVGGREGFRMRLLACAIACSAAPRTPRRASALFCEVLPSPVCFAHVLSCANVCALFCSHTYQRLWCAHTAPLSFAQHMHTRAHAHTPSTCAGV